MTRQTDLEYASELDAHDPLAHFRETLCHHRPRSYLHGWKLVGSTSSIHSNPR